MLVDTSPAAAVVALGAILFGWGFALGVVVMWHFVKWAHR